MNKTVVLNVVGLSQGLIGENTPFLVKWSEAGSKSRITPAFPAVTCSAQSNYLTGKHPQDHGVVGNGWYFHDECEVKFWKQSNKLVQSEKIWEAIKKENPEFTCANIFWWYNMYSTVDYSVTPRPQYAADGRKLPDIYTHPADWRDKLQKELGTFPLFNFWGPASNIASSRWIADSAKLTEKEYSPTLTLIYLPHLDYCLQKFGPSSEEVSKEVRAIDKICEDLITFYEKRNAQVIVLSEYGITEVNRPVHLNRVLRTHGYLKVREESGRELMDAGASDAFAVADHQVAHIYVKDKSKVGLVRQLIEGVNGVEMVLDQTGQQEHKIKHDRSGDLVAVTEEKSWFSYYYWLDDRKAPDFARCVDIHRKPGYDPVELFFDPEIKMLYPKLAMKLMSKKAGFRTLMDVIPLNDFLVKGSHGRSVCSEKDSPVIMTKKSGVFTQNCIDSTDVYKVIKSFVLA